MADGADIHVDGNFKVLEALADSMTPQKRLGIVSVATRRVFNLVQRHFTAYALTHHDSADRLGAKHTKHMERAARNMSHETFGDEGRVILTMAGIGRARHDVTIRKKDKRLTIPLSKESYGKSVADIKSKYGDKSVFRFRSKKGNDILAMTKGKGKRRRLIPLYVLKDEVFQKQDATMLPPEEEISRTGRDAISEAMTAIVLRGTKY